MAGRVLVDTGPIVAYLHRGDAWHRAAVRFFRQWRGELLTTWPVVTEAVYLSESQKARLAIMQWLQRNLQAVAQGAQDALRIERYYRKYSDQTPDLADLSLLALAERTGVRDVLTVDARDFAVYRLSNGRMLNNLLGKA
jgi:predicted nucleic acid-binding protein